MRIDNPMVSVIVPVFNGEDFLAEALDSIFRQQGADLDVIVVDDGSTDRSSSIARASVNSVQYHFQKNAGPSAARNAGLKRARGEFIAFLDADDQWPADKLQQALKVLQEEPAVQVVIGRSQFLKLRTGGNSGSTFEEVLTPRIYLQLGSAVFRRSAFERIGPFNPEFRYSEDIDWFMRAREQGILMKTLDSISLLHRLHGNNMTGATRREGLQLAEVLKKSLDRRRKAASGNFSTFDPLEPLPIAEQQGKEK
jgi:glycosyltransferase involved in cell wall biosynthesis